MPTATAYDTHRKQLFDRLHQFHTLLTNAGIPYRIVGALAVFLHVSARDPIHARLTANVDAALDCRHVPAVIEAAATIGLLHQLNAGIDTLVEPTHPKDRSAIHILPLDDPTLATPPTTTTEGIPLAPVADLVRMKLTSYRLKDRVHIQDLDAVGLITPAIEASLSDLLRTRLAEIRATD